MNKKKTKHIQQQYKSIEKVKRKTVKIVVVLIPWIYFVRERENLKEEKQLSLYEKKKKRDIALH